MPTQRQSKLPLNNTPNHTIRQFLTNRLSAAALTATLAAATAARVRVQGPHSTVMWCGRCRLPQYIGAQGALALHWNRLTLLELCLLLRWQQHVGLFGYLKGQHRTAQHSTARHDMLFLGAGKAAQNGTCPATVCCGPAQHEELLLVIDETAAILTARLPNLDG